jgi:hypothetical protein
MNVRNASVVWKMYRTRFLVKARQLTTPLVFLDALGREQRGQVGDYLVEASDGSRSIQRRQIFEDIYVAMGRPDESVSQLKMFGTNEVSRPEPAAKGRQNEAHGASRGSDPRNEQAPEERKNRCGTGPQQGSASPRRSMPDHKARVSNRPAATA